MSSLPITPARPWRAFLVVAIGVFLAVLDLFIVNVAFPALRAEFPTSSLTDLSWVLNAYAIVFAAALVPAGKLGDLYGRRRLFLAGLALFLAGSALSAAAGSLAWLVGARVVQAIGGAAMTPNSLGVILPVFPPARRAAVIGAWAAIGGIGAAAGPVLGGLLTEVSWRWIFLVNLPLGLLALILVPRFVAEVRQDGETTFPDSVAGRLAGRIGPGLVGAPGALLFGASVPWYVARPGSNQTFIADFLPGQLVAGAGIGLALPALTTIAVAVLPPARLATGIAVQTMFPQVGAALGVAIWVATVGGATALVSADDFRAGWAFVALLALAAAAVLLVAVLGRREVVVTRAAPAWIPAAEPAAWADAARGHR